MRAMSRLALALLAACGAAPSHPVSAPQDPLEATADRVVKEAIDGHLLPGVTIAISRHGKPIFAKGYGEADPMRHLRADDQTVYRIASISKQFTAAAIMLLVEAGQLALDDDVTRYVTIPTHDQTVTIRELLEHVSGMPEYTSLADFPAWSASHVTPAEIVARVMDEPWHAPPGTKFEYSNTGYVVLGMVIEKLSGMQYRDYIAQRVVSRAGLQSTGYCDESRPDPHRAAGYDRTDTGLVPTAPIDMTTPFSAGALCSTASDLVAWAAALADGKVVSPASYVQMTTPPKLDPVSHYGFGLAVGVYEGHRAISHDGGINGFASELHSYPEDGVVIAVLTNSDSPAATLIQGVLARAALGLVIETKPLPTELRDQFVGRYELGGVVIEIVVEGDKLVAIAGGSGKHAPMDYIGGNTFSLKNVDAKLTFLLAGGKATGVRFEQASQVVDGPRVP
jgi:D-alanyl-D-alanine carboxypeptidase